MKLYFLRHGIAVEAEDWKGSDAERPLTDKGRKQLEREGKALVELDLEIEAILTSPLSRAKETAEIIAAALNMRDKVEENDRLADSFSAMALGEILKSYSKVKNLMLVGHEPSMSQVIGEIIGGGKIDLKKGGLACVEVPEPPLRKGELKWLLPPKVLTR